MRSPVLNRGRGQFAGFSLGQVVAWQVGAAAVLLGLLREDWVRYAAFGLAGLTALFSLLPTGRRWLYQWVAIRVRFWLRIPKAVNDPTVDPRLRPLRELLPELDVSTTEGRGGVRIGIIQDGQAWLAVVAVAPDEQVLPDPQQVQPRLPVRSLADVLAVDDVRLASVQALIHTVPAPSGLLGGRTNAAASYQQITNRAVPAAQVTWIALRLDPSLCPDAVTARGGGLDGIHRALRRCIARTQEVLETAGIRSQPLDEEGVREALTLSAGVAPRQSAPGARHTGEDWRSWTCDGVSHVTYWLTGWPGDPAGGTAALVGRLPAIPTLYTTMSLTLSDHAADRVRFRAMVRLSGTSTDATARAGEAFAGLASSADFRALRLDGEQAPAALATMPLGGGWT